MRDIQINGVCIRFARLMYTQGCSGSGVLVRAHWMEFHKFTTCVNTYISPSYLYYGSFNAFRWRVHSFRFSWLLPLSSVVCQLACCEATERFKCAYVCRIVLSVSSSAENCYYFFLVFGEINEDDELQFSLCTFSSPKLLLNSSSPR